MTEHVGWAPTTLIIQYGWLWWALPTLPVSSGREYYRLYTFRLIAGLLVAFDQVEQGHISNGIVD